jgi:hypothetical protein
VSSLHSPVVQETKENCSRKKIKSLRKEAKEKPSFSLHLSRGKGGSVRNYTLWSELVPKATPPGNFNFNLS